MKHKIFFSTLLVVSGFSLWFLYGKEYDTLDYVHYYSTDSMAELDKIGKKYGINIEYKVSPDFIKFGNAFTVKNAKALQLDGLGTARYARLLPHILEKYPPNIIRSKLGTIKLSKTLTIYDVVYGGTYFDNIIYMTTHGDYGKFSEEYLGRIFHHEFSSILLQNTPFPIQKWMEANPEGFRYDNSNRSTIEALKKGRDLSVSEKTYRSGLVDPYGITSYENDFNLYAEMAFVAPMELSDLTKRYPNIRKKYEIVKEFYLSISPDFARNFDNIR